MSVCIVTHCYAGVYPQYATFLRYQLESIERYAPTATVAVCHTPKDKATIRAIDAFEGRVKVRRHAMSRQFLFRRCIGRNLAANRSEEDVVWFADVDHLFGPGCLSYLAASFPEDVALAYPESLSVTDTHEAGDRIAELREFPDFSDFTREYRYNRAIGGVQIVHGEFARKHGYLPGSRWVLSDDPFPCFRDDVIYRRFCKSQGESRSLPIPEVYRIRHSCSTYQ